MFTTLIVEDNLSFRQSLRTMLSERFPEMNVAEAGDAKEALERIEAPLPDLVFMDIRLPGGNGLELTGKIKQNHSRTTVIILTSYDLPEYREAAREYGADFFIVKDSTSLEEIRVLVESVSTNRAKF
ncbi:MAG: response regulator transcription factor [Deltaproteobacteria bacterium]|nr:response regulator transcription factor [Deltaproteobacteria bacterium]